MIRENNQAGNFTHTWTYDAAGNILSRKEYSYTTESLEGVTPTKTVTYGYTDANWGDLLTIYNGQEIEYDQIGNPVDDGTWTYQWEHGRQLASMSDGTTTWTYTYNADGLRTQRTNGTTTYQYIYNGSQLTYMDRNGTALYFSYHADGTPLSVSIDGVKYFYVTNAQGDVVAMLNYNGQCLVQYTYDAWGNLLSTTGSRASTIGAWNPLRYRGYVYDQETGLYYLQSRYYDPKVGRFINADAFAATGQGFTGNNMFAYCGNNPVLLKDYYGQFGILTSIAIGFAVGLVSQYISDVVSNVADGARGWAALKPTGTIGEYVVSGITGAVCAIPGAGTLTAVICDVAGPAVEQGVDYLVYGDNWDWDEYSDDVASNIVCDIVSSNLEVDVPEYVRDIKNDAQKVGLKGTKELTAYLVSKQNMTTLINHAIDIGVTTGHTVCSNIISARGNRPSTCRGLVV